MPIEGSQDSPGSDGSMKFCPMLMNGDFTVAWCLELEQYPGIVQGLKPQ